jgi:UDP-GlcNAc:undecaprenyl-phosphate GlcNAc-1-phosphate transferase
MPAAALSFAAVDLPLWARLCVGVGVAATLAYLTTPVAVIAARRFAFYDRPVGYKSHGEPTPYLGGVAVMLAFALAVLLGAGDPGRTLPLLAGVAVLLVVGTIDDRRTLSPRLRVLAELALGVWLAASGLGWKLGAGGALDAAVTGVWVVAVVNAFNLFDNMDGAASTMALVVAAGACMLALVKGDVWVAAGSAALCGACVGFLPYNLASPARIFLGDGGSMPLGFIVAALVATVARSAEPSTLGLLVGFLLVGIPALDTCLVIVSRRRRGVSVLTGGQDHLTHRTRRRVRTARRVVLVLGSAQALVSALVILASNESSSALVYIVLAFVVCAATAIVGLEDSQTEPDAGPNPRPGALRAAQAARRFSPYGLAGLAVIGLGAGISPLFSAYYDVGVWVPIGFGLVLATATLAIARPPSYSRPVVMVLVGLAGLGLLSLVSASWANNSEEASVAANLWLSYAALMLLIVVLLKNRRDAGVLLVSAGVGIAIVAVSVLVRMLGSDPGALFFSGRLNLPLGYINGEGCVFAMGCWMALSLAERREPLLAALGAAATVALACLTLLSQSRGAAIATFAAILVVLILIPGVRRRVLALGVIAAAVAAASSSVLDVYSSGQTFVSPSVGHSAATTILLASAVAGVVWGLLVGLVRLVERRDSSSVGDLRTLVTAAAVVVALIPVGVVVLRASRIEHTLKDQWHAFVHLTPAATGSATQTRLFSGGGNRYDYWRIAWKAFLAHPLAGVGAGNYPQSYFQDRHTTEAVENPHSVELQTLSELGLLGTVLLLVLVGGAALGAWRLRVAARDSSAARTLMVAATGTAVVWLVDTSGDWMHLLPGVTAIALAAIAVLCLGAGEGGPFVARRGGRLPSLVVAAAIAFVLAVGGASLLRAGITRHYLDQARSALTEAPASAITDANRALRLDSADLDAYYVKAAGYARFDRAAAARDTLLQATHEDPGEFVTWTLLGDLEVRAGNLAAAGGYYGRAHALDPNDPGLAALARDPASALTTGR